jgi:hypothetical protein
MKANLNSRPLIKSVFCCFEPLWALFASKFQESSKKATQLLFQQNSVGIYKTKNFLKSLNPLEKSKQVHQKILKAKNFN